MTKRTYDQMSKEEENKKKVTKKESCLHMLPRKKYSQNMILSVTHLQMQSFK
jgi:hypothetical protein